MDTLTLSLGDHALTLTVDAVQHLLPTGIVTLTHAFGQRIPGALALENAIADVEDAVMPATQWLTAHTQTLGTRDPALITLIQHATGNPHATSASREAIETLFSALVHQVLHPGMHDPQLPQTAEFAAALLILREAMHHWGVLTIAQIR